MSGAPEAACKTLALEFERVRRLRAAPWSKTSGMGLIDVDFVDYREDSVDDLVCPICTDVLDQPHSCCSQGHVFCRDCLDQSLARRERCPTCREAAGSVVRQRPLEGIIAKLRVRCPHADDEDEPARPAGRMTVAQLRAALAERELPEDGLKAELLARLEAARGDDVGPCTWTGTIATLDAHKRTCPRLEVACKDCDVRLMRCLMARHEATCPRRMIQCELCSEKMGAMHLGAHLANDCGEVVEPCEHGCGAEIRRGDKKEHDAVCLKKRIICPHFGCGHHATREEMAQHYVEKAEDHACSAHRQIRDLETRIDSIEKEATVVPFFCNVPAIDVWRQGWTSPSFQVAPGFKIRLKFLTPRQWAASDSYFLGIEVVEGYACQIFGKAKISQHPDYISFGSSVLPLSFPRETAGGDGWCLGKTLTITGAQMMAIGPRFMLRAKLYIDIPRWNDLEC